MTKRCETCKWADMPTKYTTFSTHRLCKRRAPLPALVLQIGTEENCQQPIWSRVRINDYCGEWEQKEDD